MLKKITGFCAAAGSIVSYSLGITEIDPLKYDLLFERFLNPARISMPDIDTDFCYERRGEVIDYVAGKYDVDKRTASDPRVADLEARVGAATGAARAALATELIAVRTAVRAEMLGQVASEFDRVHDIHRAVQVGSVDAVISAPEIRPRIITAIEQLSTP